VELVAVLPGCRGRGFGRALMAFAEADARRRRRGRMILMTPECMTDAVAFYRHLGFVEARRFKVTGHAFVQMVKTVARNASRDATAPRP
jgi:ribosomal protein S18 acetylase RimI-like enzyme